MTNLKGRENILCLVVCIGSGYALQQSPQQYKQLLMMVVLINIIKLPDVFEMKTCRDRQPEFTQIDLEWHLLSRKMSLLLLEIC